VTQQAVRCKPLRLAGGQPIHDPILSSPVLYMKTCGQPSDTRCCCSAMCGQWHACMAACAAFHPEAAVLCSMCLQQEGQGPWSVQLIDGPMGSPGAPDCNSLLVALQCMLIAASTHPWGAHVCLSLLCVIRRRSLHFHCYSTSAACQWQHCSTPFVRGEMHADCRSFVMQSACYTLYHLRQLYRRWVLTVHMSRI
jgi:hypothetical protein